LTDRDCNPVYNRCCDFYIMYCFCFEWALGRKNLSIFSFCYSPLEKEMVLTQERSQKYLGANFSICIVKARSTITKL